MCQTLKGIDCGTKNSGLFVLSARGVSLDDNLSEQVKSGNLPERLLLGRTFVARFCYTCPFSQENVWASFHGRITGMKLVESANLIIDFALLGEAVVESEGVVISPTILSLAFEAEGGLRATVSTKKIDLPRHVEETEQLIFASMRLLGRVGAEKVNRNSSGCLEVRLAA